MMNRHAKATEGRRVMALWASARCRYTVVTMKEIWEVSSPIRTATRTAGTSTTLAQVATRQDSSGPCHSPRSSGRPHEGGPPNRADPRQDVRLPARFRCEVPSHELHAVRQADPRRLHRPRSYL